MKTQKLSWEYCGQTIEANIEYGMKNCKINMLSPYKVSLCGGHIMAMAPAIYTALPDQSELPEKKDDKVIKINLIPQAKAQCEYWLDHKDEQIAILKKSNGFVEHCKRSIDIAHFRNNIIRLHFEKKEMRKAFKENAINNKQYQFGLKNISTNIYQEIENMKKFINEYVKVVYPNFALNDIEINYLRYMKIEDDKTLSGIDYACCSIESYFENSCLKKQL